MGVYASRPPEVGDGTFAWRDVQPEVDALPQCAVDETATGPIRVETYTVTFDRDGVPERGIVACRTETGARAWGNVTDADTLAQLCVEEGIGRTGVLAEDGLLVLDD
jgi:acetyl-CoA C-acetyltransferase